MIHLHRALPACFFATYLAVILMTFRDYGITWDEEVQNRYGQMVLNYYTSLFQDRSALTFGNLHLYGGFFDTLSAILNRVSPLGEYETRHLFNASIGFVGVLGAYFLVLALTGSTAFSLLGALFLFLSPRFFGHSFNNPKDIPFASFYILSLLAMVRCLQQWGRDRVSLNTRVCLGFAIGGALGTRVGGFLLLFYLLILHTVFWWVQGNGERTSLGSWWKSLKDDVMIPSVIALGVMFFFWPYAQFSPLQHVWQAFRVVNKFPWSFPILFEGKEIMANQIPWYYAPKWLSIGVPLIQLVGLALFFIFATAFWWKKLNSVSVGNRTLSDLLGHGLLVFAMLFPLTWVMVSGSTLYDGFRHLLFLVPLIGVLSSLGFRYFLYWGVNFGSNSPELVRWFKWGLPLIVLLSMTPAIHWMIRSHPNQYIFFNEAVGGLSGAFGQYDTDYYGNSERQAAIWLNEYLHQKPLKRKVLVCSYSNHMQVKYFLDTRYLIYNPTKSDVSGCDLFIANLRWGVRPKGTLLHAIMTDNVPLVYIVLNNDRIQMRY